MNKKNVLPRFEGNLDASRIWNESKFSGKIQKKFSFIFFWRKFIKKSDSNLHIV